MSQITNQKIQRYQRLIEISSDLASTFDLDSLLRKIIWVAVELSEAEVASILLYDKSKNQLYFQATTNPQNESLMQGIVLPAESIPGWVANYRQPVIVSDVHKDKRWFNQVEKKSSFSIRSIIAVPMIAQDKLVGVIEVLNKQNGTFTIQDQETLEVLGAQAAVAIENTHLFQQTDFIAELVHELRTPLTSIITISYLLQRPEISNEERRDLAQSIEQETRRLAELTSTFLDFARLESGRTAYHLTNINIYKLLQDCILIYQPKAAETKIKTKLEVPIKLPTFKGDHDKIKQVILNLLNNAIKYNRTNGNIFVRAHSSKKMISVSIQDTGIGISEEDLQHLFDKFFRAQDSENRPPGTGLGLAICKRITESHGGTIEVKSTLGVGSTFTIHLPLDFTRVKTAGEIKTLNG